MEKDIEEEIVMDVRNCKSCGTLFNYTGRVICPACAKKLEEKFGQVKEYIRENPNATIAQVAEDNEVSVNQIRNWIKEERLILSKESAIGIECERCGKLIRTGRICDECKKNVTQDLQDIQASAKKATAPRKIERDSTKNRMRFLNGGK